MIERGDVLSMAFLKKSPFTGSLKGMRYRLEQEKSGKEDEAEEIFLKATIWEGPYAYASTPEEKKESARFSFDENGIGDAINWLNEAYQAKEDRWKQALNQW